MSEYFFVVSQMNGFVLDISGSTKGGDIINSPADGGPNQLWRWNGSQLVSKLDLVLDINGADINGAECARGTKSIALHSNGGLNQKWRFEEGAVKSNMNDLVLDVEGAIDKAGTRVIMWDHHGGQSQKWFIVPQDAWDDFKLVQANPNPLTRAHFWKSLADNYLNVILGYSVNDYEARIRNALKTLNDCASTLDEVAIAGLLLAPFTDGRSLDLTVAGAPTGVTGAATSLTGNLINQHWDGSQAQKVREATEPAFRATLSLQGFLNEYIKKLKEAAEFLKTSDGEAIARDAFNVIELIKEAGTIAWNIFKIGNTVVTGEQHVRQAKEIQALVNFIQADYYALNGARIGLATHAAAPGVTIPVLGKTLVAAGTTSAKVLSSSMAIVGVAFGIWDIVGGAKKIAKGSELADEFRKTSKNLEEESSKLIKLYKELQ